MLNVGRYVLRIWFGENRRYLLWGHQEYVFEVAQAYSKDGMYIGYRPGIVQTDLDLQTKYIS